MDRVILKDSKAKPTPGRQLKAFNRKNERYWDGQKHKFAFNKGEGVRNLNEHITGELEKLQNIYENENDKGRYHGYRRAITFIRGYDRKIESVEDVKKIPYIGSKIKNKVEEILRTGTLRRTKYL